MFKYNSLNPRLFKDLNSSQEEDAKNNNNNNNNIINK